MKYIIHQLPIEDTNCFRDYSFVRKDMNENRVQVLKRYNKVYEGEIDVNKNLGQMLTLEEIYKELNINHPEDYKARSLSVSDIIELEDGSFWFCDVVGYVEL